MSLSHLGAVFKGACVVAFGRNGNVVHATGA